MSFQGFFDILLDYVFVPLVGFLWWLVRKMFTNEKQIALLEQKLESTEQTLGKIEKTNEKILDRLMTNG